jgi:RHS repeat-associated protein
LTAFSKNVRVCVLWQRPLGRPRGGNTTTIDLERDVQGRITESCALASCNVDQTTHYVYDAGGERVRKTQGNSGTDRLTLWPWLDVDLASQTYSIHYFAGSRRLVSARYSGLGSTTSPQGQYDGSLLFHSNHVGSNVLVTDSSTGAIVQESVLDPFGELLAEPVGPAATPYVFTDQEHDVESALDYFGARYYDPWVGRFMSVDPESLGGVTFGRMGWDTQNANVYSYAVNRPTVLIDPTGRTPMYCAHGWCSTDPGSNPTLFEGVTFDGGSVLSGVFGGEQKQSGVQDPGITLPDGADVQVGETEAGNDLDSTPRDPGTENFDRDLKNVRQAVDNVKDAVLGSDLKHELPKGTTVTKLTFDDRIIRAADNKVKEGAINLETGEVAIFHHTFGTVRAFEETVSHEYGHNIPGEGEGPANGFQQKVMDLLDSTR